MHPWVEVFAVFVVSHLAGDFILQTGFQATRKQGGLGADPVARRALGVHTLTYTACFVPALAWLADDLGTAALVATALAVAIPHALLDDGRALHWWLVNVKRTADGPELLPIAVDQSFHLAALLVLALLVGV